MKKKRMVFLSLFAVLLSVMSLLICSLYKEAGSNQERLKERVIFFLEDNIGGFVLGAAQKLDTAYQPLQIAESIQDETLKQSLSDQMAAKTSADYQRFAYDGNLDYWVRDTKSGAVLTNQKAQTAPDFTKDSLLYVHLVYDEQGKLSIDGDMDQREFSEYQGDLFLREYDGFYVDEQSGSYLPASTLHVENPKHMEVFLRVPEHVILNDGDISTYVYSVSTYAAFLVTCILSATAVLALFLLFYPVAVVKEVQPFRSITHMKAEVAFITLPVVYTFAIMGVMMFASYSIAGVLPEILDQYGIWFAQETVLGINVLLWFLLLLLIAVGLFYVKYMFACGFLRYLKEDTILGGLLRKGKHTLHNIARSDLDSDNSLQLAKLVGVNLLAIVLCCVFWGFGIFLAFVYSVAVFLWLKKRYSEIQSDYERLRQAAHELAQGSFEDEIDADVGMFNSLKDEFKNIKTGFEQAVKEETKSQNMKTELITNVSHDLKTPLTGIRNYVELLSDETLEEPARREYIHMLGQYTNRLSNLIEDLFEVSKVNSGNLQLEIMELDLSALLKQVHAECGDVLEEKHLQLIEQLPSELPVCLDGGKTYRIFENLITNIGKYALASTRVYIEAQEQEENVVITFKNISETPMNFQSEEIVERFVRGDKSRHTSGSGLGLAIVKSFTEAQKGSFRIETDGDLFKAIVLLPKRLTAEEA